MPTKKYKDSAQNSATVQAATDTQTEDKPVNKQEASTVEEQRVDIVNQTHSIPSDDESKISPRNLTCIVSSKTEALPNGSESSENKQQVSANRPCHQAPEAHTPRSGSVGGRSMKEESRPRSHRSRRAKKESKSSTTRQTTVSEYFPVRRSTRRCKSDIESEKYEKIASKIRSQYEEHLEVIEDKTKGRGVITTVPREKGDFICEYSGELISFEDAKEKEEEYSLDSGIGCYMYYFEYKNKKYCVDATKDNGRMGRLVNHSRTDANVTTKLYEVDGTPFLCLMASRAISAREELLYDYGERSKEAIQSHPWLES